ncbi:fatty acid CoA ligase family protein [Streptomyces sp. NPDC057910]|uniref:fatty acid CoA ligase family protein n=1 Tax=Streptomyces sp. NPDC057910 TaxID=3346278 RepID=UPI0036EC6412
MPLAALLAQTAARRPHAWAVIHPAGDRGAALGRPAYTSVDFASFASRVTTCAAGLEASGIRRGMRTALLVPPGGDLLTLVFSMLHVGAVPVVVDPGMGLNRMLDCVRRVEVEAFVGVPAAHALRRLRPRAFTGVRASVRVGRTDGSGLTQLIALGTGRGTPPAAASSPDDLALIAYTTGSTGPAKPVEVTAAMLAGMADGIEEGHFDTEVATTLVTVPLMGVFDLVKGRTVVVPKMDMSRVASADPAVLADAVRRFSVDAMFASPALLAPLAAHLATTGTPLPSLRVVVSGGAPVSPALMRALRAVLTDAVRIYSTYGATEALPMAQVESRDVLTGLADGPAAGLGVCLGRPAPGMALRTISISDGPVPRWTPQLSSAPGAPGEIVARGLAVSPRYYRSPQADANHKIQDGRDRWHRTGDIGCIDEQGRIWFYGRKSQRVRTANGDLHTVRCENVFNAHPAVERTALVGTGPPGRQRPVLCVEPARETAPGQWPAIESELRDLGASNPLTKSITTFLVHPGFPVDVRHNAKIRRELLSGWAEDQLSRRLRPTVRDVCWRAVPLSGWAYIAAWPFLPLHHPVPAALWWADLFLSVVGHAVQIPAALRAQQDLATGRTPRATIALTMLLGATWWRTALRRRTASLA